MNKKIMLVDDYAPTNLLHTEFINALYPQVEIETYTDAFIALKAIKGGDEEVDEFIPNIICLDINMPLMSGWEFLEAFKIIPNIKSHNISIYMLSTFDDEKYRERALAHPYVEDYFTKPLTADKLKMLLVD